MDFLEYTDLLQNNGVITKEQAREIRRDIKVIAERRFIAQKKLEDDFFDNEFRYGSS